MLRFLLTLILTILLSGCAQMSSTMEPEESVELTDQSCSYFYFLWGTHAEYSQHFEEALDAYQKALVCDPESITIQKKVPILLVKLGQVEEAAQWLKAFIEKHPDETSQYLFLAHLAIQQENREEAIRLYQQVLTRDKENEGVRIRLGILYSQQQQYREAEEVFTAIITTNPESYLGYLYLARLLFMVEKMDEAAAAYEKGLALNWSPELAFEMADLYKKQENHEGLIELYSSILAEDPANSRATLGRVQALLNLKKDSLALKELKAFRDSVNKTPALDLAVAKILLRLNQTAEAEETLKELTATEAADEAYYLLALLAYQNKNDDEAIGYLDHISPGSMDYAEGIYLQVRILRKQQNLDEAILLLENATQDTETSHPLFFALLSSLYLEADKNTEAIKILDQGISVFPEHDLLLSELGLLYERNGQHDKAMEVMQQVIEINDSHAEALNFVGYSWADENVNLDQAYDYIKRAVEQLPDNGYIRDSLGWIYFRLGNFDKAIRELKKAIELQPDDPLMYDHLGDVYLAKKSYAKARQAYMKALELSDSKELIVSIEEKINGLP